LWHHRRYHRRGFGLAALERVVCRYGGLDMLVLNAGDFPGGCRIDSLSMEEWREVMAVNLDANLVLMREAHPAKLAPRKGRVVVVAPRMSRTGSRGRRVFRLEGGAPSTHAGGGAGVGRRGNPHQHTSSQRRVRHRDLDR
jgi:NAD(P)-dependent dehydrogenase (short-subunit alcohol dehydrogenase family)